MGYRGARTTGKMRVTKSTISENHTLACKLCLLLSVYASDACEREYMRRTWGVNDCKPDGNAGLGELHCARLNRQSCAMPVATPWRTRSLTKQRLNQSRLA